MLGMAPFNFWPLLLITFPVLIWLLDGIAVEEDGRRRRLARAAFIGWCFGFGYFTAGLYWMGFAFLVEADKYAWMMPLAVAALPAALAIFTAVATAAAMLLWGTGARRIFALTVAMFAADWLRGHILTGFPWNLWGYALTGNEALAQVTSLIGIYGLTFVALVIFTSPAALGTPVARRWVLPVIAFALLATGWGWGQVRLGGTTVSNHPGVKLRIVQANIPQAGKFKPENRQWIFDRLIALSRNGPDGANPAEHPTHIIWPETAVPFLFVLNGDIAYNDVRDIFATLVPPGGALVLGAERVEGPRQSDGRVRIERVYNSLFVLGENARIAATYDKTHLVPFGEYVPLGWVFSGLGFKDFAKNNFNSGFTSGTVHPAITAPAAAPFSPLICYEAIFPSRVQPDESRAAWLLNITNDAWFGTSTGPYQHFQQARVRAIEEGLPLVRAANTGISAVIDPFGRLTASLGLNQTGAIDAALPHALSPTPFRRWGEMSLIAVALLIFLLYRFVITVE